MRPTSWWAEIMCKQLSPQQRCYWGHVCIKRLVKQFALKEKVNRMKQERLVLIWQPQQVQPVALKLIWRTDGRVSLSLKNMVSEDSAHYGTARKLRAACAFVVWARVHPRRAHLRASMQLQQQCTRFMVSAAVEKREFLSPRTPPTMMSLHNSPLCSTYTTPSKNTISHQIIWLCSVWTVHCVRFPGNNWMFKHRANRRTFKLLRVKSTTIRWVKIINSLQ